MTTRLRLITCIALSTLLLVSVGPVAWAAGSEPAKDARTQIVSLELKDVSVKDAVARLFEGTGLKYTIEPGVSGRVIELTLKGVTFTQALDALAEAARFTYKVQDGTYILSPAAAASGSSSTTTAPTQQSAPQPSGGSTAATVPPGNTPQAIQSQTESPAGQQTASSGNVVVNEQQGPVFYGQPPLAYNPYGFDGFPPVYQYGQVRILGGYPPVVVAGGNPYIIRRVPRVPPPPGYVNPDVLRFLRGQYAIRSQTIITPY